MNPGLGEVNMGALVGAIVGAIGGLFALGIAPAILSHDAAQLFETPKLGLISFFVSGTFGWLIGGQIGPRLANKWDTARAEIVGGLLGGFVPVTLIALWGWYMVH
jgi:hypothetical protein